MKSSQSRFFIQYGTLQKFGKDSFQLRNKTYARLYTTLLTSLLIRGFLSSNIHYINSFYRSEMNLYGIRIYSLYQLILRGLYLLRHGDHHRGHYRCTRMVELSTFINQSTQCGSPAQGNSKHHFLSQSCLLWLLAMLMLHGILSRVIVDQE